MSQIIKTMRKNKALNSLLDRLYFLKIWKRNMNARPIRKIQTSEAYRTLDCSLNTSKRVFFLGVPTHKNMGDQAQRYCINKWIENNFIDFSVFSFPTWPFYSVAFRRAFIKNLRNEDVIIIQSGYCTTSRHYDHYMHRYIVKHCKANPILIMPQTVNFICDRDGFKTGKIYNEHTKLLFLARDRVSYGAAKKYFSTTNVKLYPDIVTSLIGTYDFNNGKRQGVLICRRNDGEKKVSDSDIHALQDRFISEGILCRVSDTNADIDLMQLINSFGKELEDLLQSFASYKVVITDRYHGTLFSLIANTPVIVLETIDHKVKTGTEWFKGIYDGAYYNAKDMEDAYHIAKSILSEYRVISNSPYFKERYYDHLYDEFEGCLKGDE